MSTEQTPPPASARPSHAAITKMLVEMEVARKYASRYWMLAILLPLAAGAALLIYTSYTIHVRLERLRRIDDEIRLKEGIIAEKDRAIKERDEAIEEQNQTDERKNELLSTMSADITDPKVKDEVIRAIEKDSGVAAKTPRVFIFYPDAKQEATAKRLAASIRETFPSTIVFVKQNKGEPKSEVLYFDADDSNTASKVQRIVAGQGLNFKVEQHNAPKAGKGLIEIWFPATTRAATPAAAATSPPKRQQTSRPENRPTQTRPRTDNSSRRPSTPSNSNSRRPSSPTNSRPAVSPPSNSRPAARRPPRP